MKEAIINYFQTQQAIVNSNLELAKGTGDIDALHDLRVAVKRLKALYQILEPISGGLFEYKVHFNEIKKLFKTVGDLRDLQVQSQLFATFAEKTIAKDVIGFYQFLQQLHNQETKNVEEALYLFNPEVMNDSLKDISFLLDQYSTEKGLAKILKYQKKRLKQIKKLLRVENNEDKIHLMRTRLKQVLYIGELITGIITDVETPSQTKGLKKAAEALGHWHDHIMLRLQLKVFMKETPVIKYTYRKVLKQIKVNEAAYLEKARKQLYKYF